MIECRSAYNINTLFAFKSTAGYVILHVTITCSLREKNIIMFNNSFMCRYLRMQIEQNNQPMLESSKSRHNLFQMYGTPKTKNDVIQMLGEDAGENKRVFFDSGYVRTIAVGQ